MKARRKTLGACVAAALVVAVAGAASAQAEPSADADELVYWEMSGVSAEDATALYDAGFDVAEYEADGAMTVIGDEAVADELRERGFEPEFFDTVYKDVDPDKDADVKSTYYGGYRTADEHYAHIDEVASANPELAETFVVGESWLKTQGQGGHDIKAICLTNKQPGDCELSPDSAKPRISLVAQIHAREIATGEIAWRFVDYLAEGYGDNDQVTQLLDSTEVWIVPIVNPDGVDIVASGGDNPLLQRKNANDTNGNCSGTQIGIDLNRNHSFKWGGASNEPCSETYHGPSAASEPEVAALEELFGKLHPDQRGDGDSDAAPADTRDVMISLHSYGEYIIHPWAWETGDAPNADQLRALGDSMAEHNGYQVGNASDTVGYLAPGATDDYTYGAYGIASYTFEVGGGFGQCGGFLPAYSCVDGELWEPNRDAIMT
ncbi:MAG: M14 family zinc carboxypeptidase, partial [Stackebrandtia sp.]